MKLSYMLIPSMLASIVTGGCQSTAMTAESTQASAAPSDNHFEAFPAKRTAKLWVKGLACPYCVTNVDRQLTDLPGVERVQVDLPTGEVQVVLANKFPATREQLTQAIDDSGFTLDRIEMPRE